MSDPVPPSASPPPPAPAPGTVTVGAAPPQPPGSGRFWEGWSPLVRTAATFYAIVALFAFGYALFGGTFGRFLGEDWPDLGGILGGIAIGGVIVGVTRLGVHMWDVMEVATRDMARMLGPITRKEAIWLAVFSSVAEELLFRGALWPTLGLLGTSLLFALVHVVPRRSLWIYPVFALGAGFLLGLLRGATDNVIPCILAHLTVNGLNLWYLSEHHARLADLPPNPAVPHAASLPQGQDMPPGQGMPPSQGVPPGTPSA